MSAFAVIARRCSLLAALALMALGAAAATSSSGDADHAITAAAHSTVAEPASVTPSGIVGEIRGDDALACGLLLACSAILVIFGGAAVTRQARRPAPRVEDCRPAPRRLRGPGPRHLHLVGRLTC